MKKYRFWQVDAFTRERYLGNPAAVVFNADALSDAEMQTIARQLNLSETVFLCRPSTKNADYRGRIFTPKNELPFAGHPTIAAAFAHLSMNVEPRETEAIILRQECGIGVVSVAVGDDGGGPLFTITMGPPLSREADVDRELAARMLTCDADDIGAPPAEVCSTGLPWLIVPVRTLAALKSAAPDLSLIERVCREREATGLTAYCPEAELDGCSFHVRSFAPGAGIAEDPVCGSGNGAAALHIARHVYADRPTFSYRSEQGLEVSRRGILHLHVDNNDTDQPTVRLGGHAVRVMEGHLLI